MDMTWNVASFLIDCTFHTGWRSGNWVNAGKKEGVFHLAGDARRHCYIKCGTRPLRISKRGIIFPYFALSSPSKMHPAAKRVCRCCRNLSSETAALSFSERPVLVLHRHNKSTHHLGSCCGVSISVSMTGITSHPANLYEWRTLSDTDLYVASECTATCEKK